MRPTGLPTVDRVTWGTHLCQLYRTREDLTETLVPFFKAGLEANEQCLWVASEPLGPVAARAALEAVVPDLDARIARGQIEIVERAAPASACDREDEARRRGFEGLRVSGEIFCRDALHGRRILALCNYSLGGCGPDQIIDLLRHHRFALVRRDAGWEAIQSATLMLASLDASGHAVRFWEHDELPVERIAEHLARGSTLAAATRAHQQRILAAMPPERAARVRLFDAEELADRLVVDGHVSAEVFHETVGAEVDRAIAAGGMVRVYGEIVDVLAARGQAARAIELERVWSEFVVDRPVELLCGYSLSSFADADAAEAFRHLCEAHRHVETAPSFYRIQYERAQVERERAEAANRAKDEFLAMLGHELRNPLSPILTAVQLMRLRTGDILERERTIIERQVNHMVRLVDDLLDVSRITRGKVQLKRVPTELSRVVAQAIEVASPLLEDRNHRLTTSVPSVGLLVDVDANRFAQVIANLLTNAAKYTPPRGSIKVTAQPKKGMVALTVRDNGVGIEPELLPRIFELFVQGKQQVDRAQGGLGLGLAIAHSLVEMHGGTLRASSAGPGQGSEFVVELPRLDEPDAAAAGPTDGPTREMPAVAGSRVLVVDDNRDAAGILAEALEALGHEVRTAHDGPSALELVPDFQPHVALVDLGLPIMDGYELARRLQELGTGTRLVAVTGYGQESDRRRTEAVGFHRHFVKPVDLEKLHQAIRALAGE